MQQNEKKYFLSADSMLDSDSADFVVPQNAWVNMENVRTGSTDKGVIGTVESVGSTTLISEPVIGESYLGIGSADDVENQRFVTFYYDKIGSNHKIECCYTDTNTIYTVLKSDDITGQPATQSQLVETFDDLVYSTSPDTIVFTDSAAVALMLPGDTITLSGTSLDGTYTIDTIVGTTITVLEPVTTQSIGITYTNVFVQADGIYPGITINGRGLGNLNYIPAGTLMQILSGTAAGTYTIDTIEQLGGSIPGDYLISTLETPPATAEYTDIIFEIPGTINVYRSVALPTGLGFTTEPIHSARIVNGLLYWVDSTNNQPRKVNIEAGIKAYDPTFVTSQTAYTLPLDFREITIIKPTAPLAPNIVKQTDITYTNNFIQNESFEFAFQYIYNDNETTVTGTYSPASRLNFPSDTYNFINVTMDLAQSIPSTIKIINLICRVQDGTALGGNYAFVVKTWNVNIPTQLTQIQSQNNGVLPLSFNFYNNITGQTLATDDVLRPFDNVPIYAETLEAAKNRIFMANNTEGYSTPKVTSLSVNLTNPQTLNASSQSVLLYSVQYVTNGIYASAPTVWAMDYSGWYVYLSNTPTPGYYLITYTEQKNKLPPLNTILPYPFLALYTPIPTSVSMSQLTFKGTSINDIIANTKFPDAGGIIFKAFNRTTNSCVITSITQKSYNVFAQQSPYKFGVVFYDFAMRKCGVVGRTDATEPALISTFIEEDLTSTAPGTINLTNAQGLIICPGDTITIQNSLSLDGTYSVITATYNGTDTTITVGQTIGTSIPGTADISIYRVPRLDITTPPRNYNYNVGYGGIQWSLGNANALNEIPEWAYYYTVVRTLNLRTRFFIQAINRFTAKYATKKTDGTYSFTNTYVAGQTTGIALNTESLNFAGLGYVYNEKDYCLLVKRNASTGDQYYTIPVIGQVENYILLKPQDLGDLSQAQLIYEIYTPYQTSDQEPYYEMGEMYEVTNPGTVNRQYSSYTGLFKSDAYAFERNFSGTAYYAGAMSPNDLFYKRWDSDAGKSNFITDLGQVVKNIYISWSDVFVPNTAVNGLSTFRLFSEIAVPQDCGSVNKLQLTSKVQSEGTVMLSICTSETNSMYLQETQITDSTGGTQFFSANSSQVISTINTLKGSFGTINPEAVVEFRGSVYYPDANRGVWAQYSSNGLFPISSYKMTRFWKQFFAQYVSMTKAEIEELGSRPYIFSTVDASHMELVISIPKLLETPPKGYLPDYPEVIYPFDIWDGQGKTIVYNLESVTIPQPHWQGSYSFNPEWFISMTNKLYSIKDGDLYLHNQTDSYNNFYGTQYSSKIMVIANQIPQRPKTYNNVSVESNKVPDFVYFYNDYPYIQTSDLVATDFRDLEGVFYATLYRNKIIPTNTGFTTNGLLTGEYMRNVAMKVMFQFDVIEEPLELKFLNVGYTISRGHTT